MKTIGLLGGMSWESTLTYYRLINEGVRERLGGLHSAKLNLLSVDFHEIAELQHNGRWEELGRELGDAARKLELTGADFVLIGTNTMHMVYDQVCGAVRVPVLHIADATGEAIRNQGVRKVLLLGTRFTMEQDFYKVRLGRSYGLEVIIPDTDERELIHRVIYDELVQGKVVEASGEKLLALIRGKAKKGCEGVIAGCTEIGLLVRQEMLTVPFFDTTEIHARAAVELSLA